jgi:hypothetical protein
MSAAYPFDLDEDLEGARAAALTGDGGEVELHLPRGVLEAVDPVDPPSDWTPLDFFESPQWWVYRLEW